MRAWARAGAESEGRINQGRGNRGAEKAGVGKHRWRKKGAVTARLGSMVFQIA